MRIIGILFFVLLVYGCKDSSENPVMDNPLFSTSIHLKGMTLLTSKELIDPWVILSMDSLLIIGNKKGTPLLELYTLDGKLIRKILQKGQDSSEVRLIGSLQPNYAEDCFYVFDLFAKKTLQFSIKKVIADIAYQPALLIDYQKLNLAEGSFDKNYINDDRFFGESKSPKGRILSFKAGGKELQYFASFPMKVDSSLSDAENAALYPMGMAFSPDRTKLATATYDAGLLDLFSLTPSGIDSIWSLHEFLPGGLKRIPSEDTSHMAFSDKSMYGYPDIVATDEYVYAIFSGRYFSQANYSFSNIVRVVSWDGKRGYKLILDHDINRLTVSKDNNFLYGISINKAKEPEVIAYKIKDILK